MAEVHQSIAAANANAFIPTIWSTIVLDAYVAAAVVSDRVDRRFEPQLKKGDTVSLPSITQVVALARTANTDLVYNTVVESSVNVTVNQDYYVFRILEPMAAKQSVVDLLMQYATIDAKELARTIDAAVAAYFDTLNSNTRKGTLGTAVIDDNLIDCVQLLDTNNVPHEDRSWIISPETWADLMKIDKFVRLDYVNPEGGTAAMKSKLNYPIYGAPVFVANTLEVNAGNHNCALIHREAIMLVIQQEPTVVKAWDTRRGADSLLTEAFYGINEERDLNGICLQGR
jgi:hypothetical protein